MHITWKVILHLSLWQLGHILTRHSFSEDIKNRSRGPRPEKRQTLKFTTSRAGPGQRLGTELDLFKKPFGLVPCVCGAVRSSPARWKAGLTDRPINKQLLSLCERDMATKSPAAWPPQHHHLHHSSVSPFYLSCHHLTAPKRWNGENRGALNLCFLPFHCLFTGNHFTVWPTDWTMLQKLQLLHEWFSQAVWKKFWLFYSNMLNYICDSGHICFHMNFTQELPFRFIFIETH